MPSTSTDRLAGVSTSLAIKAPVKTVAILNITLAGEQTVNGVAVTEGDRVLVTAQNSSVENGIYDVSTGAWTRSLDFDGNRDVVKGTLVATNSDTSVLYRVTTADPIVIGTSAITIEEMTVVATAGQGAHWGGTAGGTANALTLTPSEPAVSYATGDTYRFLSGAAANTGAVTIAISGLAAKSITKGGTTALEAGDIPANAIVEITYDGTRFQIVAVAHAALMSLAGTQTVSGTKTFSGGNTHSGTNTFSGANTFSASNDFTAAQKFTTLEIGHASDTTLSRSAAGILAVEGEDLGYLDIPVAVALTRGKIYPTSAGITINTATVDHVYGVYNDSASSITLTQGGGLTMRLGGSASTGNRTLAARGLAWIWFRSASEAICGGMGVT